MKKIGWTLLIVGVMSFMGSFIHGRSVAGPCFFGALGVYLIKRSKDKDNENKQEHTF